MIKEEWEGGGEGKNADLKIGHYNGHYNVQEAFRNVVANL